MISLNDEPDRIIYGRVYMYDEQTKTLIMKVIDTETYKETKQEHMIGMGVYNVVNVTYRGIDYTAPALSEDQIDEEWTVGEVDNKSNEYKEADKAFKAMLKDS